MAEQDEFKKRYTAAKNERKQLIDGAGREIYKFCFNGREAEWDNVISKDQEPEEIFTDVPSTLAEDFAGELFSTMMPENADWVEYQADADDDQAADAQADVQLFEQAIDGAIKKSNFYDEGHTAFQDAVIGNVAMWVDRHHDTLPAVCEAIPLPQLHLRLGPYGIADRFRTQWFYASDLPALFPDATFSKKLQQKIDGNTMRKSRVVHGFWPDYSDMGFIKWAWQVRVDDEPIGIDQVLDEEGKMPLVVGRFNAVSGSPWGRGPGFRMLPTIRVLNAVSEMTLEGMDKNLDPAYTYPHDGILDLSDGIESGIGYPSMPGSAESVRPIGTVENLDYGFYSQEKLEEILRDGFYREVVQRGKTPPSASQFIGQEQKQLRRIARPAGKTWSEFGVGILKRFEYLERNGGSLEGQRLPLIEDGKITVRPISPLERAQAREDVLVAQSIMDMAVQAIGPEGANMLIKMPEAMKNIKDKLKDKLVTFRTEEEIRTMMQEAMAAQQAQQGATNANQG